MMLIASLNQVNFNAGYTGWSLERLANHFIEMILMADYK